MMLYRPNPELVHAAYMLHALQSPRLQKYLDVISGGSTVGHVKVGEIRSLLLPCPVLGEQLIIAEAVNAVRSDLSAAIESRVKLGKQKQGLMHDLLTGRIRMPDLTKVEPRDIARAE
jgi:type I restriction enzyme S subunit